MKRTIIIAFIIGVLCSGCIVMGKDIRILSSDGKEITGAKDIGQGNLAEFGTIKGGEKDAKDTID